MNLNLYSPLSEAYSSKSQKIRVLSESWVNKYIYCPCCGGDINEYENNKPVADFYCASCQVDYELKSKKNTMGKKIVDGAYSTMIERLKSDSNPNFFFLNYDKNSFDITNFIVIPKHFFIPEIIEKRKPLSQKARRSGWVGCNILLDTIPDSGKIFYIKNGKNNSKDKVLDDWNRTKFLQDSKTLKSKGWLLDIIRCLDEIGKQSFSLRDIYQFENHLKLKHPENNNILAKIRQQLQILRDRGYLKFQSRGQYKIR
ncbi:Type II restriction enzyme DpnI (dpnC) [uncultured Gammaproteobacteria bacterium]|jgi:type II restriction enzyme|nr:Type II restriction enzyme DpnI (dpnC) [uncultured Gammaproteobacteria bacterium]VVH66998.1 Type II restriction enzyme DpnI (dpnC) [uncultured Gammaproteobacteria bacterium]